jgi:hypothetical protein
VRETPSLYPHRLSVRSEQQVRSAESVIQNKLHRTELLSKLGTFCEIRSR